MARRRDQEQWTTLVRAFEGSGLTHEEYSEAVGVSVWTFRSWLYKLRKQHDPQTEQIVPSPSMAFIEVMAAQPSVEEPTIQAEAPALSLTTREATLSFEQLPPSGWLAELVLKLEGRC